MRYLLLVLGILLITACSSGDSDSKKDFPSHLIEGNNISEVIDRTGTSYDLKIIGDNNNITVRGSNQIRLLKITGTDNNLTYEAPMLKAEYGEQVVGCGNTVYTPTQSDADSFIFDIDFNANASTNPWETGNYVKADSCNPVLVTPPPPP